MNNTKKTMKIPKPLLNDCLPIFKYLGLEYNISSNLWLQKLTYFIYKEAILKHNILLFSEEFESWKYGPVLRTAYNYFQDFENERTDYRQKNQKLTFSDYLKTRNENETEINNIFIKEKTLKNLIETIVRKYEKNSLTYLLTTAHDKYWKKAAMSPEGVIKKDWLFTDFSFINNNLQLRSNQKLS